jgi:hypothetical protein
MPPTFGQFFAGSAAHRHNRLYRLVDGSWKRVSDPSSESMRSGEAFWIYSDGRSDYQGPLRVDTLARQGLVLGERPGELVLRNLASHPLQPKIHHLAAQGEPVPLAFVVQVTGDPRSLARRAPMAKPSGPWLQEMPPLEAGASVRVPMATRLDAMHSHAQVSLLRIDTDLGTESWVPVVGIREDLEVK